MKLEMSIKKILINQNDTIHNAMKKMNLSGHVCLVVVDQLKKFKGTITDGDIRRHLLKDNNLEKKINQIYNKKPIVYKKKQKLDNRIKNFLKRNKHLIVPVVNHQNVPISFMSYQEDIKSTNKVLKKNKILIMAGGIGFRMKPFTDILPKPLVPYKGKPMILNIMDNFKKYSFNDFTITLNKKEKILDIFLNQFKNNYTFNFFKETKPLGTAGSLKKIDFKHDFFLTNCDSYININLQNLLKFHQNSKSLITIVASIKSLNLSFGECILDSSGKLKKILEKPQKNFLTNTGMYVIKPDVKNYLPKKIKFGMDEVISSVLKSRKKISVFPIPSSDWKDTGNWMNYLDIIKK
jgi:dTDP-glucose pyrophosphorylase